MYVVYFGFSIETRFLSSHVTLAIVIVASVYRVTLCQAISSFKPSLHSHNLVLILPLPQGTVCD